MFPRLQGQWTCLEKSPAMAGAMLVDEEEWTEEDVNVEPASSSADPVVFDEV